MEKDLNKIISNSLIINKNNLLDNIDEIINKIKISLSINKDLIVEANNIDLKNKNGFVLNFNTINKIFENIENEDIRYGRVLESKKDNNIIYGKQIYDYGTVIIVTEGNTYVILEMILRNILAGNNVIFNDRGYMYGTNELIIELVNTVLEQYKLENMIQKYTSNTPEIILKNYANIDQVICIGNSNLQKQTLKYNQNKILLSGFQNYDIYIETKVDIELLNKIQETGYSFNYYVNKNIKLNHSQAIQVADLKEAVGQINYSSNKYSAAIFTTNKENASEFIKNVKTSYVTVNTSPTIEQLLDIKQSDLVRVKTVIYPNEY